MVKLNLQPTELDLIRQHGVFDDFPYFVSTDLWTDTSADTGATVAINATGVTGQVDLTTGATDNNEAYLHLTNQPFIYAANKPLLAIARIKYAEAATNAANVMFGLMSAVGADTILDNGAGPKASFSGAVIYKVDGGTVWRAKSSVATVGTDTVSRHTAGGASFHSLMIRCIPVSSTLISCTYFLDSNGGINFQQMQDNSTRRLLIEQKATLGTPAAMSVFVGVKAGGANSEVVSVDYLGAWQLR